MATKKFVCKVCGYVHEGSAAPAECPVCKAPASQFVEQKPAGLFSDKNSNAYIILYSTVMVVIVALMLAVAALSLQQRQYDNELNEKKNSILKSLNASDENFDSFVTCYVVDSEGNAEKKPANEAFDLMKSNKDLRERLAEGRLILFRVGDGRVVVPLVGKGLWDDIWGYIALDKDMNTVSGIIMDHKGETPGLGAEIASPAVQQHFEGKKLFEGNEFVSIAMRKGGAKDTEHEVDAITGGTKTSDGVTAMLRDCLKPYVPYFMKEQAVSNE